MAWTYSQTLYNGKYQANPVEGEKILGIIARYNRREKLQLHGVGAESFNLRQSKMDRA